MSWANAIKARGAQLIYNAAWRRAQKLRAAVERAVDHVFQEMVTVGIDVLDAPDLGAYTPHWEPLSDSWEARKGFDEFYFHTGALEQALLGKNTQRQLGRPQVFLEWPGKSIKVHAGQPAAKYEDELPAAYYVRVLPFPRLDSVQGDVGAAGLVATPGTETFYKLVGPHGLDQRPLISPFLQWWIHIRMKRIMKGAT